MFKDEGWDGDPVCPKCGNWPCTCNKHKEVDYRDDPNDDTHNDTAHDQLPEPCPVCGNLPCTCEGKKTLEVQLSLGRKLTLHTNWQEKIFYGDKFIDMQEYIKILFGKIPTFFSGADDLRKKWSNPETRQKLLQLLEDSGFGEEKLDRLKKILKMESYDLLDVLEYIAYNSEPMERQARVKIIQEQYLKQFSLSQQDFDNLILGYYAQNGFRELSKDNLKTFISIRYNSMNDAKLVLGMSIPEIREHYFDLQKHLYGVKPEVHIHLEGGTYIENGGMKIVKNYGGDDKCQSSMDSKPLTEEDLKKKIDYVYSKLTTKRLWFSVCKYMMWHKIVPEGDFIAAVNVIEKLYKGTKLDSKDLSSLNVQTFRKSLDKWNPANAPVSGNTYNKYYTIAELMDCV